MNNPFLTLPPRVGQHYRFRYEADGQLYECEIIRERNYREILIYDSKTVSSPGPPNWTYWPDGEAKISGGTYVATLVEDIFILGKLPESEEFKELREMMKRYQEKKII